MPFGAEVGLGPGDIVLNGDPAPPHGKGQSSLLPHFRSMTIVAKRLDGTIFLHVFMHVNVSGRSVLLFNKLID